LHLKFSFHRAGSSPTAVLCHDTLVDFGFDFGRLGLSKAVVLVFFDLPNDLDHWKLLGGGVARQSLHGHIITLFGLEQAALAPEMIAFMQEVGVKIEPDLLMVEKAVKLVSNLLA